MALDVNVTSTVCSRCAKAYGTKKGNFPVSYSVLYKGTDYMHICKECINSMFNRYLSQSGDEKLAVRQMCRKLDLYWNESIYNAVKLKNTSRTIMTSYITKTNTTTYAGKCYDDTLIDEGTLWNNGTITNEQIDQAEPKTDDLEEIDISEDIISFWGPGYTPDMYLDLEQRKAYWMSNFPKDAEIDIGTQALIRQACNLEIDINRDRAVGKSIEKSVNALNAVIGSMGLKPAQKKSDDLDNIINNTPLGVWAEKFEYYQPIPEIDDDLKDVNRLQKYIFTWMGHLCKMLNKKAGFTKLYDEMIEKLRIERPESEDEDDEELLMDVLSDTSLYDGEIL